jgi:glycosyltransferase involved in cell wall biosynthesis
MLEYSFIIPVYNRPNEIDELLESFCKVEFDRPYEIVIIEDGSEQKSDLIVENYSDRLDISYYYKSNSGPGASRNYGMSKAKGNYFIVLDSDVILPPNYLMEVEKFLNNRYVHAFGGPDDAHASFSDLQKAINFAMTSFLTTGGIRGGKKQVGKFQPRSFNMGISKEAFESTGGYGKIHPGEDPDLTFRIWNAGYETALITEAKVFHKRRISWSSFMLQVYKFGVVRPILSKWHKGTGKVTFWFPTFFSLYLLGSIIVSPFCRLPILSVLVYLMLIMSNALSQTKSLKIAFMAVATSLIQFLSYGYGFLLSNFKLHILKKQPMEAFPKFFFS